LRGPAALCPCPACAASNSIQGFSLSPAIYERASRLLIKLNSRCLPTPWTPSAVRLMWLSVVTASCPTIGTPFCYQVNRPRSLTSCYESGPPPAIAFEGCVTTRRQSGSLVSTTTSYEHAMNSTRLSTTCIRIQSGKGLFKILVIGIGQVQGGLWNEGGRFRLMRSNCH